MKITRLGYIIMHNQKPINIFMEIQKLASDEAVSAVFENTRFGSSTPREVIADTLLKVASGYATGSTALACCSELGLIELKKINSTKRKHVLTVSGGYYLYEVCKRPENPKQAENLIYQLAADFDLGIVKID